MQNSSGNNLQSLMTDTMSQLASTSLKTFKPLMDSMLTNLSTLSGTVKNTNAGNISLPTIFKQTCNCCPPECECPPHCIAAIARVAAQGERIIVPFIIKNTCSQAKTYRVGVRDLKDQDGNLAPMQPKLNKQSVTLQPGSSEQVLMDVDLEKFNTGSTYSTEIVLREKEINQNICFTLQVSNGAAITATPQEEKQFKTHWQSWQSHYYCEPDRKAAGTVTVEK